MNQAPNATILLNACEEAARVMRAILEHREYDMSGNTRIQLMSALEDLHDAMVAAKASE